MCFEITGSHRIRLFAVLRSVEFHDQFHGYAAEVGDVGWDRVLAPELQAIQLPAAQVLPELLLGIGHVAAQTACIPERGCWQRWFDCRHFAVPSPQPSPDGRGSQKRGLSSVVVGSGGLTVVISPYPHPSPLPEGEGAKGNSPRYSTPRFIWSRSMLSNRAWKLPSPKPSLPLRWMISKKIGPNAFRSEEHTSELQSLMRISYAVFCLKKKTRSNKNSDLTKQNSNSH